MPRGGARPGSGRKPLSEAEKAARAAAKQCSARVLTPSFSASALPALSKFRPPTTDAPSPVEEFDAPNSLSPDERHVWLQQAPHAFKARTLTRATAMSFERYCKVVVLESNEAKSSGMGGSNHRGLLKQINAYELQFLLTPCGKPIAVPPAAPKQDEDDAFFGAGGQ